MSNKRLSCQTTWSLDHELRVPPVVAGVLVIRLRRERDYARVCKARLQDLDLLHNSHFENAERRRLYNELEAQLGVAGLTLGLRWHTAHLNDNATSIAL
jgi:hypothetical protein